MKFIGDILSSLLAFNILAPSLLYKPYLSNQEQHLGCETKFGDEPEQMRSESHSVKAPIDNLHLPSNLFVAFLRKIHSGGLLDSQDG